MRRVLAIARREFIRTVLTKGFIIGIVVVPFLLLGVGAIAGVLAATQRKAPLTGVVALSTTDDDLAETLATLLTPDSVRRNAEERARAAVDAATGGTLTVPENGAAPGAQAALAGPSIGTITIERTGDPEAAPLRERLLDGGLLAIASVPDACLDPDASERARFRLLASATLETEYLGIVERAVADACVRVRLRRAGTDHATVTRLIARPGAETERLLASGRVRTEDTASRMLRQIGIPLGFAILLWIAAMGTGQNLLMATIEEKSNRVMEVLLSAVSPLQLLAGKIAGQCGVGFIIVMVYGAAGVALLVLAASADLLRPLELAAVPIYFLLAYLMVASLMVAVGSAVSDLQEANTLLTPVMLVLMVPLMLLIPLTRAPNGVLATILSFIPPAGPLVMVLRITAEEPVPLWQVPASIAWAAVCVAALLWMAARVFRVGVLMTGKPPSPIELLRWIRAS